MNDRMRLLRVNLYCTENDFKAIRNLDFAQLEDRLRLFVSADRRGNNTTVSCRVIPVLSGKTTADLYLTCYDESDNLMDTTDLGQGIVHIVKGSLSMIQIDCISVEQVTSPCFIGLDR